MDRPSVAEIATSYTPYSSKVVAGVVIAPTASVKEASATPKPSF
ncbi:MAG: hypothetical protein ABII72_03335 [Parcubacteria group bacterium]